MKKFFIVFIYLIVSYLPSREQDGRQDELNRSSVNDSVINRPPDSGFQKLQQTDSLAREQMKYEIQQKIEAFQKILQKHIYFPFDVPAIPSNLYIREETDHELLFYFLIALLSYFALIRLFFGKYLDNLITLFFRVTMRQQQIREQLLQTPLPSLLLNILFAISSGFYLSLLSKYYGFTVFNNFWLTFLYATLFVSGVYLVKYIGLKLTGWIFNIRSATDTYIFIVFLVNKMVGIFLLPIIMVMSFASELLLPSIISLSYVILILFLCYRFINAFRPIRTEIKVNRFHFFLYLCAFEIAPLLLICKVLLAYVERSN